MKKKLVATKENLWIYNEVYEKAKSITSFDETLKFLEDREKFTYKLEAVEGLEIISNGLKILFDVIETDENLIAANLPHFEKEFFIPRYVWNHLCGFLGIPGGAFQYYQSFRGLINKDAFKQCQYHEGEVLKIFFNNRLEKMKKENSRLHDIFITVFKDGFGEYPRIIHSNLYYPYRDSDALSMLQNGIDSINRRYSNDKEYEFKDAYISPYSSEFHYTNKYTKKPTKAGEEVESGIAVRNSECKYASFGFQGYVIRLACLNGVKSTSKDKDLMVKHYEHGFQQKVQRAFVKALQVEDKFAQQYLKSVEYNNTISEDWADVIEIPSNLLSLPSSEKEELAEIGKTQGYKFSPYGIVQALTYKSTHRTHDDTTRDRINDKTVHILDEIEILNQWQPHQVA